MLRYLGREIPETLDELVAPVHTALIVVDVQNDFCSRGGAVDVRAQASGRDVVAAYAPMLTRLERLTAAARQAGVPVVYLQQIMYADHRTESAAQLWYYLRAHKVAHPKDIIQYTIDGTWGAAIVERIAPQPSDVVVRKFRSSGFVHTQLEHVLRSRDVRTVVVTGVVTEGCVESTVRDAQHRDFFVAVPTDCVGSVRDGLGDAALRVLAYRCDLVDSAAVAAAWAAAPVAVGPEHG